MRVYVPDKRDSLIKEALKELYLLRQEVDFGVGTPESKIIMIDKIRSKLQDGIEEDDQMFVIGELVRTISNYDFHTKRIGLITEIKYLKNVQYCRVLWTDKNKEDWVCADNLHEL